jgi:tetratricopeptide (TPR) repeat protein
VRISGDFKQAETYYRDSLAVSRPFQMNWHATNSFVGLAQALLGQGKIEEAIEAAQESLSLAQSINAPDVMVEVFCTLSEIQLAQCHWNEAEENAQNAARLASQIGVSTLLGTAWRLTSVSRLRLGKIVEAKEALDFAWKALEEGQDQLESGRLHVQALSIALAENDLDQARHHQTAARLVFTQLGAARDLSALDLMEIG